MPLRLRYATSSGYSTIMEPSFQSWVPSGEIITNGFHVLFSRLLFPFGLQFGFVLILANTIFDMRVYKSLVIRMSYPYEYQLYKRVDDSTPKKEKYELLSEFEKRPSGDEINDAFEGKVR